MEPNDQGQLPPAGTANGQGDGGAAPQGDNAHAGFQARIDQLTAQAKQVQDMLAQERQNSQLLMAALTEMSARQTQPGQQEQPPQVDPERAAEIRSVMSPILKEVRDIYASVQAQMGQLQFNNTVQTNPLYQNDAVRGRAQQLMQTWQQRGLKGWTPEDAFKYAYGEVAAAEAAKTAGARQGQANFNSQSQVVQGANGVPQVQVVTDQVPADINSWPIDKQTAFWEKRAGDKPF